MAKIIEVELKAKTGEAIDGIKDLDKSLNNLGDTIKDNNKSTEASLKDVESSSRKAAKGIRGIGTAIKAAGIGLLLAAVAKLKEVFEQNQKVLDFFNTTFEALSLAFNDFFNFIDSNFGVITDYFKGLFEDPVQNLKDFGRAIYDNIIERVKSALEALGFLGDAVVKVFQGDFAGAAQAAKEAGKELIDVVTGVDNTFEKVAEVGSKVVGSISEYTKSTIDAARANVELNKQAELAIVIQQGLIEKYDRQAEKLRQIRDDESLTIEERIAANNKLGEVLNEQEAAMLRQVDIQIQAAQAQYEKNKNQENYIALLEAQNEKEGVLAQIEGFRSEQLMNINSLERERQDAIKDAADEEIELAEKVQEAKNKSLETGLKGAIALVGENSKFGKGIAIASAIRDTFTGANKALAQGGLFGAIGAAGIIASGIANVRKITATDDPSAPSFSSVSSASVATPSIPTPTPPQINTVGTSGINQIADTIANQQPVKAYVVSKDVSTAQELDRNKVESASI